MNPRHREEDMFKGCEKAMHVWKLTLVHCVWISQCTKAEIGDEARQRGWDPDAELVSSKKEHSKVTRRGRMIQFMF